jgi:hypothetical protein
MVPPGPSHMCRNVAVLWRTRCSAVMLRDLYLDFLCLRTISARDRRPDNKKRLGSPNDKYPHNWSDYKCHMCHT